MKNIIVKCAIALVILFTGTVYHANAKSTEAKEAVVETQTTEQAGTTGVKSRIRIRDGKMSYVLGIPMSSTYSTDFELKDRKGNIVKNGTLQPSKVVIFSSDKNSREQLILASSGGKATLSLSRGYTKSTPSGVDLLNKYVCTYKQ